MLIGSSNVEEEDHAHRRRRSGWLGKTAIVEAVTPRLLDLGIKVLIITNDVVTTEDAKHVQRTLKGVLLEERILGVETGACPHTAVRENPSMNFAAVEDMEPVSRTLISY